jgi:hypothetical protein
VVDSEFNKSFPNYIDFAFALLHFSVIIFSLFLNPNVLVFALLTIMVSGIQLLLIIYVFKKNNPLYIYYCYALLLVSTIFLIFDSMVFPTLILLLVIDVVYFYNLTRGHRRFSALKYYGDARYRSSLGSKAMLNQDYDRNVSQIRVEREKQKEFFEEKYNSKKHLAVSTILSFLLVIFLILSFQV